MITTELIKELRDATGVSVMQCKKALEEADGNMEKALLILKKKSGDVALKKADRDAADGVVVVAKSAEKGIILTLHCETDFVAKNADFTALAKALAEKSLTEGIENMKSGSTEMINSVIQKIGENIKLGEVTEMKGTVLGSYIHDGKIGVLVSLTGGTEAVAKDVAMHIVAMKPEYTRRADIPEEKKALATELFKKEVDATGKPEEIKQKMLSGKIDTFFKENTLLDQAFVKNPDQTIEKFLGAHGATLVGFIKQSINK